MTRSQFQPGPAQDHYHDTLGVDEEPVTPGGVTNSAPAGAIAVSDGTNLTGSDDLTWNNDTKILGLVAAENGGGTIAGIGPGVQLFILAAEGDADHVGGELTLESGASDGQNGGNLNIKAGNDGGGGNGGPVVIYSGTAADGESGDITIKVGGGGTSASGGDINITAGSGLTGSGGSVVLSAGPKNTGGSHGTIQMYSALGSHSLELSETAGFVFGGGVIVLNGLPSSDPANAGQLWNDGGTLKVSAG